MAQFQDHSCDGINLSDLNSRKTWFAGQILVIEFHEINVEGYNSKNACLRKLKKETIYGNTH
ncbi:hypothetical protein CFP56_034990 [Quercus suber]|uniref:Uncharacterized protein n=1 Tax=Quercus suber TaxID=58331 RepID=A0AAW0JAR2_QUESU